MAQRRRDGAAHLRKTDAPPSTLTPYEIEAISAGDTAVVHGSSGVIRGTRVSGSRTVEGRARVVSETDAERGALVENFADGDIIVTPMINPSWLPYFSRAGGFISEAGACLSHTSTLARAPHAPWIVGTNGP